MQNFLRSMSRDQRFDQSATSYCVCKFKTTVRGATYLMTSHVSSALWTLRSSKFQSNWLSGRLSFANMHVHKLDVLGLNSLKNRRLPGYSSVCLHLKINFAILRCACLPAKGHPYITCAWFWIFLTHINTVLNICQTGHCLDPLTQLFCGRDIWMVPKVKWRSRDSVYWEKFIIFQICRQGWN